MNQAAFLTGPEAFSLREVPMPVCGPEDVLVRVCHVGVCGSDVHFFLTAEYTKKTGRAVLLGHECSGIVVKTGERVTRLRPGDAVALEPGIPCGKCSYCREGKYNLCPDVDFMAAYPFHTGALQRYIRHPAAWAFKLPEGMSTLEGAMIEPFAVGMHAARRGDLSLGKTAVILGAGCIGLSTLQACRTLGAGRIVAADLYDCRLEKALELGADAVVNTRGGDVAALCAEALGEEADIVFETAGSPITAAAMPAIVRRGGKMVMVGNLHEPVSFDFAVSNFKEADVIGLFRYRNLYPACIHAVSSGMANLAGIVTDVLPFERVQEAFERAHYHKETAVKVCISFDTTDTGAENAL
ncbi:MAG: NAD(P)-dependent alcohol dehydrogenase [Christensenellales bacterium]|jgi:L-iditol 2-dehydrogenase